MHLKYLKDQIYSELNDAVNYLKKAIDVFAEHPDWAKKFKEISDSRERTATELYTLFVQSCSEMKGQETYISSIRDVIVANFSSSIRKIEDYEVIYNMMVINK